MYPFGNNRLLRGKDLNFNYTWHGRRLKFWAFNRGFFNDGFSAETPDRGGFADLCNVIQP